MNCSALTQDRHLDVAKLHYFPCRPTTEGQALASHTQKSLRQLIVGPFSPRKPTGISYFTVLKVCC